MKKLIVLLVLFLSACGSGGGNDPEPLNPDAIVSITVLQKWPVDSEEMNIAHLELATSNKVRKVWWCKIQEEIKIGDKLTEQQETEEGYENMTGIYVNGNLVDCILNEEGRL